MEQVRQVKSYLQQYKAWVLKYPEIFNRVEASLRIASYVVPGKSSSGSVLSELLYSSSSVLSFFHDCILRQAAGIPLSFSQSNIAGKLLSWLTILEHMDVFFEVAALSFGGKIGHWIVIAALQLTKALLRLILLFVHKSGIQYYPAIPGDRKRLILLATRASAGESNVDRRSTYTLGSTGRTVRKLGSSSFGPDGTRDWQNPAEIAAREEAERMPSEQRPTPLNSQQTFAEFLHIIRPIAHLGGLWYFGTSSWKPWLASFGLDVSNLLLLGDAAHRLNASEKLEMRRRALLLLLYLLRTPFYDRWSRGILLLALHMSMYKVPPSKYILKPLAKYVPYWQEIYSYCWSS